VKVVYVGQEGKLLSHNLFTYCSNKPVTFLDSEGHMEIKAAPSLSTITLEAFKAIDIPLPAPPFRIVKESTDSNNVTTVILENSEPYYELAKSIIPAMIYMGEEVTTYTYKYSWRHPKNLRDWYEYNSVNSSWLETSLAFGAIFPAIGAAITLTEDFIVKPNMVKLPHTPDPERKIFQLIHRDENTVRVETKRHYLKFYN